jgi:hypothetical protein
MREEEGRRRSMERARFHLARAESEIENAAAFPRIEERLGGGEGAGEGHSQHEDLPGGRAGDDPCCVGVSGA